MALLGHLTFVLVGMQGFNAILLCMQVKFLLFNMKHSDTKNGRHLVLLFCYVYHIGKYRMTWGSLSTVSLCQMMETAYQRVAWILLCVSWTGNYRTCKCLIFVLLYELLLPLYHLSYYRTTGELLQEYKGHRCKVSAPDAGHCLLIIFDHGSLSSLLTWVLGQYLLKFCFLSFSSACLLVLFDNMCLALVPCQLSVRSDF